MDSGADQLSLVRRGPSYRFVKVLGLDTHRHAALIKNLLLVLLTWAPLVLLSFLAGHALPGLVKVPFFQDSEVNGRLLATLPLLQVGAMLVDAGFVAQARSFIDMNLICPHDQARFFAYQVGAIRRREWVFAEVLLYVIGLTFAVVSHVWFEFGAGDSSWERCDGRITLAGWWYILVSWPLLLFLVLRWLWVFCLWAVFLFEVSRLDLDLSSTHPDRAGGLGFLSWGVASFAPVLMSMSAMVAAGLADMMYHDGVELKDLKFDVGGFVILSLAIVYAPLLAFSPKLARSRFSGLLKVSKLILHHDRAFEKKWYEEKADQQHELLGSGDIQSLADGGVAFQHVNEMLLIPFDTKAFAIVALASLAPFAALLPIKELVVWLGELLV